MKKAFCKVLPKFLIGLMIVFSALSLAGCVTIPQELTPMSFEYTLTDEDVEETLGAITKLEEYIDEGENSKILSASKEMEERLDYIHHQYVVGEAKYYSDLTDEMAYDMYVEAEDAYMTLWEESIRVQRELYESDLKVKDRVFEDWTEAEIKELCIDSQELMDLEREQSELYREYLNLENPESEEWSTELEEIYFEYVDNAKQIAAIYDYENYYDYESKEHYMRDYSPEERENFRRNVKDYILPLYIRVNDLYKDTKRSLSEEEKEQLSSLMNDRCDENNEFLTGYMDSYPEEMQSVMEYLFQREAVTYTESEDAHIAGYTNYSYYLDQPFVFLGNECQDILTVVHEMGHYVSLYHFTDSSLPYDTCEVHSQGNEWLMIQYLDGKLDEEVYDAFLLCRLKYGLETIVLSTVVDEYEEEIYAHADISSSKDFEGIMSEVMAEYDGLESAISMEEMYTYAQYVTIESPVYYLSYATSEVAAMSFYALVEEQGYEVAQEVFVDLCLKTPADNLFFDTLEDVGLPDPFKISTIDSITESFDLLAS